jgi:plastocyanin
MYRIFISDNTHLAIMNSKKRLTVSVILAAGTGIILFLATSLVGIGQMGNALAQNNTNNGNNSSNSTQATATPAGPAGNGTDTNPQQQQQPMPAGPIIDQKKRVVVLQGTVSSFSDPADPSFNSVDLLPARMDGAIYEGTITFSASKKVIIGVYQGYGVTNSSQVDSSFGEPLNFPIDEQNKIAISVIQPDYGTFAAPAATMQFVGNGLTAVTLDGEPFVISYSLSAVTRKPQLYTDVRSAMLPVNATGGGPEPDNPVSIVPGATRLADKAYSPSPLTVKVGDTVTWINNDFEQHTVTSGTGISDPSSGQELSSYLISFGGRYEHAFTEAGAYEYYCQIHPMMRGEIVVEQ